jgi:hypothetical protein
MTELVRFPKPQGGLRPCPVNGPASRCRARRETNSDTINIPISLRPQCTRLQCTGLESNEFSSQPVRLRDVRPSSMYAMRRLLFKMIMLHKCYTNVPCNGGIVSEQNRRSYDPIASVGPRVAGTGAGSKMRSAVICASTAFWCSVHSGLTQSTRTGICCARVFFSDSGDGIWRNA